MKDMREYIAGRECGNIVKRIWVDGVLIDNDSESIAAGVYFEYILAGNLPKSGEIPKAEYKISSINAKRKTQKWANSTDEEIIASLDIKDMYEPYEKAHNRAIWIRNELVGMGLKIVEVGAKRVKGRFEGGLDLICKATKKIKFSDGFVLKDGHRIIIDLKYSGLLDDKYSKHGWMMSPIQLEYHGTQAKQYHFVGDLPFFFLVCSSGKEPEIKFLRMVIDEHDIEMHIAEGNALMAKFEFEKEVGFVARPEFNKCRSCPLYNTCEDRHTFPHAVPIYLTDTE